MDKDSKIYVAGHTGMVGSAIVRCLKRKGYKQIIGKTMDELDLTNQAAVEGFFKKETPEYVFLAAAKVGGIMANSSYPADFIMENELIQCHVIRCSHMNHVKKLMFLGSSCIYPTMCPQPIKEEYLLTGPLEPSNEAYALAKISGMKMCQYYNQQYGTNYISVMPTNLYGVNDRFDINQSHVIPAIISKMQQAKVNNKLFVGLWGTGNPVREFLYVDDMAEATVFLMENYSGNDFFNIGTGKGITIKEVAKIIRDIVGFKGEIAFDHEKPDGTPVKVLDISRIKKLGWSPKVSLEDGIRTTYDYYLSTIK